MNHKERALKASKEMIITGLNHPETPFAALSADCQLLLCVLSDRDMAGEKLNPEAVYQQFSDVLAVYDDDAAAAVADAPPEMIAGLSAGDRVN